MKAVIMAGGESTRLRPLTCKHPKPMVPVMDRPVMEYIIELLRSHGFTDILVTLFYLPDAIRNHFGDGSSYGVNLRYFVEEFPLGTAGSVRNASRYLNDTFLVISGDTLTDIDLTRVVEFHKKRGAIATLALSQVDNPLEYGVVMTDEEGRITRFLEKPSWAEVFSDTVNTGTYVLEPAIFDYFAESQVFDFSKDLFPLLMRENQPVYGLLCPEYWCDIGSLAQYRQAHYDLLSGRVRARIQGTECAPGIWIADSAEISQESRLEAPCYIGPRAKVKAGARIGAHSVVGSGSIIDQGASLKRSILWSGVYAGKKSELRGAVICNNTTLKQEATCLEGAVIGDDCTLGKGSVVRTEVKVWPEKRIDSGSTVNSNVIWGTRLSKFLFGPRGVSGLANLEITPEYAAKLGAGYGSIVGAGSFVAVSSDDSRVARMLKRSFISGLLSTGVNVYEVGSVPSPVTRFIVRLLKIDGGVHLRLGVDDDSALLVEFFDSRGFNIHRNTERKLENIFAREDFKRVDAEDVGELVFLTNVVAQYMEGILMGLDVKAIRNSNFKVALYCENSILGAGLPVLLEKLGCTVVSFPEVRPKQPTLAQRAETISLMSTFTVSQGADLGVVVEENADRMIMVTEKGRVISEEDFITLISYILLTFTRGQTIAIPVTVPRVIEELAREYDGAVLRSRVANPGMILGSISEEKVTIGGDELPEFQLLCDAITALVKIMELMAVRKLRLSELIESMPRIYLDRQEVHCPLEEKGSVMRSLLTEFKDSRLELIEGIKIVEEDSWTLIIPDDEEPVFTVFSEASSQEKANALTKQYVEVINRMRVLNGELRIGGRTEL